MICTGDGVKVIQCLEMPYLIGAEGTVIDVFPREQQYPIFVKLVAGLFNVPERYARGRVVCSFREDELEVVSISEKGVKTNDELDIPKT